jgi:hypothetical protein
MRDEQPSSWPEGTGEWRSETLIVARDAGRRLVLRARRQDATIVGTPLELIARLESPHHIVATVVIDGAADSELAGFVRETYPHVVVVDDRSPR